MAEIAKTPENLDRYISDLYAEEDTVLRAALENMEAGELPSINVSSSEGKLLQVLALACKAERILEIGTLGGYSTIWLARALPIGGQLISLELNAHHADVAQRNIERAGLADRVEIRVGPALDTLQAMKAESITPFDLVFIDADKDNYLHYLEHSVPLVRVGGLILGDNTLTHSALDPDADTGITRYNKAVADRTDLISVIVPTLRDDIDGLTVSVKIAP